MPGDALDVFIAYSHEDETLRQELEEQLARLRREGLIGTWHERRITTSEEWRGWIDGDLTNADLVLVIVSAPFLESGYCEGAEIKHALERHAWGHGKVIPIIARPCDWSAAPFAKFDTLPQGVGPVTEWHDRDGAWEDVSQGIREVARRLITARLESTAAYRIAVRSPIREENQPAEAPPEQVAGAGASRWAIAGGLAAVLAALAAGLYLVLWPPQRPEDGVVRTGELRPPGAELGRDSAASGRPSPEAAAGIERPVPPSARSRSGAESADAVASRQGPAADPTSAAELSPEDLPPPEVETTSEESPPVAETEAESAEPAVVADQDDAAPEQAVEDREPEKFERSLGILAALGAEDEGECIAVLIADDHALTSKACALASGVMVMGGNALVATRDEIFDLEPWPALETAGVDVVKLLQGLGETYGFAATELEESFDYESLDAHYVEESAIRRGECATVASLAEIDGNGIAYVENAAFEGYALLVEEAADEAISIAGSEWAALLREVLDSGEENLAGLVCQLPERPRGNLVFSEGGRVVGIGYPCEPFDRLEPEVRDSLPDAIRQQELGCIVSLTEIRQPLLEAWGETAGL